MDTAEYILKEERKEDPNTDLTAYNGAFDSNIIKISNYIKYYIYILLKL